MAKKGIGNPLTDAHIVSAVAAQLEVDAGLSASDMVHLVLGFHGVNANNAPQLTLPITVDQAGTYHYKGGDYGDTEFPDQPQDQQVVDQFLGVGSQTNTMTDSALPGPGAVTVSVLNGTGTHQQAATTAAALKAIGFHATAAGNSTPVAQ